MDDEQLIYMGDIVKAVEGRPGVVAGWLIRFTGPDQPDLEGEYFSKNTDLDIPDEFPMSAYYHHGKDGTLKKKRIGRGTATRQDAGVWIEAQLDLSDAYVQELYNRGILTGKMGWSSGPASHLVEIAPNGEILQWPLKEASITYAPAEPRNRAIPLKSLLSGDTEIPAEAHTGAGDNSPARVEIVEPIAKSEDITMSDQNPQDDRLNALETSVKGLTEGIAALLEGMQSDRKYRDAGYYSDQGGNADHHAKSFGDFLLAVSRHDDDRIQKVYKSFSKDLGTTDSTLGGYLVPHDYRTDLYRVAAEASQIIPRVTNVPVNLPAGSWPALDQYFAPTAGSGQTALAGRVKPTVRSEGSGLTETEPQFTDITYRLRQTGGFTDVEKALTRFSPVSIEALLTQLFGIAINARRERDILRGNGSTEYLGILTATTNGPTITVTADTAGAFLYEDMLEMMSRFKRFTGNPVWICHPSLIPEIGTFQIGTDGAGVPQGVGMSGGLMTMPGTPYPVLYNEHLPQLGNNGAVVLADLSAYYHFTNGDLTIAFSDQVEIKNNKDTWVFYEFSDGMPALKNKIALADPQGSYTVSPFVILNNS